MQNCRLISPSCTVARADREVEVELAIKSTQLKTATQQLNAAALCKPHRQSNPINQPIHAFYFYFLFFIFFASLLNHGLYLFSPLSRSNPPELQPVHQLFEFSESIGGSKWKRTPWERERYFVCFPQRRPLPRHHPRGAGTLSSEQTTGFFSNMSNQQASRPKPAPPGNEEATANLNLGEFQNVDTLTLSEASLVLNALVAKRRNDRKNVNETEFVAPPLPRISHLSSRTFDFPYP